MGEGNESGRHGRGLLAPVFLRILRLSWGHFLYVIKDIITYRKGVEKSL
jgi:hypothetical protein